MDEHGAPAPLHPRSCVVIDFDDQIVEMVIAPEPVPGFVSGAAEPAVIAAIAGVLAPRQLRLDASGRQQGGRPSGAVGPPPKPQRPEPPARRRAIPFELVGTDAGSAEHHRNGDVAGKQYAMAAIAGPNANPDQGKRAPSHEIRQPFDQHRPCPGAIPACSFAPECSTSRNIGLPARRLQGLLR